MEGGTTPQEGSSSQKSSSLVVLNQEQEEENKEAKDPAQIDHSLQSPPRSSSLLASSLVFQSQESEEVLPTDTKEVEKATESTESTECSPHRGTSLLATSNLALQSQKHEEVLPTDTKEVATSDESRPKMKQDGPIPTPNLLNKPSQRKPLPRSYSTWKAPDLRKACRDRNLQTAKSNEVMVRRLKDWETNQNQLAFSPTTRKPAKGGANFPPTGTSTPSKRPRSSCNDSDEEEVSSQKEARIEKKTGPDLNATPLDRTPTPGPNNPPIHVTIEQETNSGGIESHQRIKGIFKQNQMKSTSQGAQGRQGKG